MSMRIAGASALGVGAVLAFSVAATHPSGHEHGSAHLMALMSGVVHAAAILGQVLLTFGALMMTRIVWRDGSAGAWLAFVLFCAGTVTALSAAMMSGFVTPQYLTAPAGTSAATLDIIREMARLSMRMNQAYGFAHQFFAAAAVLVWALSWPKGGVASLAMQLGGIVAGLGSLAVLGWLLHGGMRLNPHIFAVVTIAQAAWFLGAAAWLASLHDDA